MARASRTPIITTGRGHAGLLGATCIAAGVAMTGCSKAASPILTPATGTVPNAASGSFQRCKQARNETFSASYESLSVGGSPSAVQFAAA